MSETANITYRILLDAKNERQYALEFANGRPTGKLHVFGGDNPKLGPNETIFAFDAEDKEIVIRDSRYYLSTTGYQIDTDADGNVSNIAIAGAEDEKRLVYEIRLSLRPVPGTDDAELISRLELMTDSLYLLEETNFNFDFPDSFMHVVDENDYEVTEKGGVRFTRPYQFPPHHRDGGLRAQMGLEELLSNVPRALPPSTTVSEQSNKSTKPMTAEKSSNIARNRSADVNWVKDNCTVSNGDLEAFFTKYAVDVTALAKQGRLDPVVGRDNEIRTALGIMSRRKTGCCALVGDPGAGKTAILDGLATALLDDEKLPDSLKKARVIRINMNSVTGGSMYRGQLEERMMDFVKGLIEREGYFKGEKIIIEIDEIGQQLGAGGGSGAQNVGNMMKEMLTSRGISVIGGTTLDEYRKYIEKDSALSSRFQPVTVNEPGKDAAIFIMKKQWPAIRDHQGIENDLTDADYELLYTMGTRYAPAEYFPRKGEKLLEDTAGAAAMEGSRKIERRHLLKAISNISKLSVDFLGQNDREKLLGLEETLKKSVLGQDHAMPRIADGLIGARMGLASPEKPMGCFVLQGPTGVGKTETARALSRELFGTDEAMLRIDMSEYSEKHTVSRLIGAAPGYVGFEDTPPLLLEHVRKNPYSVVVLDEIEKAHPEVLNVFLSILDSGSVKDNHGHTVKFANTLFIMTSNLGAKKVRDLVNGGGKSSGMSDQIVPQKKKSAAEAEAALFASLERTYQESRKDYFTPEMINRIESLGGFIVFRPLTTDVINNLMNREIANVEKRLNDPAGANLPNVSLSIGAAFREKLAADGYQPDFGARPLNKVVREKVANKLSKWVLLNEEKLQAEIAKHGHVTLNIDGYDDFKVDITPGKPAAGISSSFTAVAASVANDNNGKAAANKKTPRSQNGRKPGGNKT